ncbi:MAG: hypothetical protein ACI9AO_001825 [Ilumatobacter sp.]|jgi:hypothetical protein
MTLDIETQIRRIADAAFDETSPVEPALSSTTPDVAGFGTRGRWMLFAAASILVIALVGALTRIGDSTDRPIAPVDSVAPITTNNSAVTEPPVDSVAPITTSNSAVTEPPITAQLPSSTLDFSAQGVLAEVPFVELVQGGGTVVEGTDLVAIAATTGVESTGDFDLPFLEDSDTSRSFLFSTARAQTDDFEQLLSFSFLDIERITTATHRGVSDTDLPLPFDVVALRSDVAALAAEAGPDRIIDVGDGPDGEPNPTGPLFIGVPLRIGVDEQRSMISVSRSTPFVAAWLDADSPTLADEPDLAAAAAVLDRDEALYATRFDYFNRDLADFGPGSRLRDRPETDFLIVEEFTTIALGWSGVGQDQRTTIAYVFADETAASASVEPIATLFAQDANVPDRELTELGGLAGVTTVGEVFVLDDVEAVGRTVVVSGHAGVDYGPADIRKLLFFVGPLTIHR